MSVIEKGMEMPEECNACPLANYNMGTMYCKALTPSPKGFHIIKFEGRREDCPLVEVKEPHGRLGDLDKLKAKFRHSEKDDEVDKAWNSAVRRIITQAATIIEPEGSETK